MRTVIFLLGMKLIHLGMKIKGIPLDDSSITSIIHMSLIVFFIYLDWKEIHNETNIIEKGK